jgi:hypothetical protein
MLFDTEKTETCAGNFPRKDLKPALEAAQKSIGKEHVSNSNFDADYWLCQNCNRCQVPNGDNKRAQAGLDCVGEYCVALGFITGAIPQQVVEHFGIGQPKCKQFVGRK